MTKAGSQYIIALVDSTGEYQTRSMLQTLSHYASGSLSSNSRAMATARAR
jgi:hypothetical protein